MLLIRSASITVAAPREHVAASVVRSDLATVRFFDPRVERVESNGLPDGAVGQSVRMTARVWGQEIELVQTILEADLPERVVDRMDMPGDSMLTEIRFAAPDASTTRLDMTVSYDIAAWKLLTLLATSLAARSQVRKALARFKEFAEMTYLRG